MWRLAFFAACVTADDHVKKMDALLEHLAASALSGGRMVDAVEEKLDAVREGLELSRAAETHAELVLRAATGNATALLGVAKTFCAAPPPPSPVWRAGRAGFRDFP